MYVRINNMQQNELTEIMYMNMDKSQNNNVEQKQVAEVHYPIFKS